MKTASRSPLPSMTTAVGAALVLLAAPFASAQAPASPQNTPAAQGQPAGPPRRDGGPGREGPGRPEGGRGGPAGFLRMMPLMQALDSDQNGELSAEEIARASAALKTLDKNKDGKLSADELRPAMGDGPRGGMDRRNDSQETVNRLLASDKNADGKLSADELPERMKGLMARGDTNKDGFLTREELTALMANEGPGRSGPARDRQRESDERR